MAAAKWSDVLENPKYQSLSDAGKSELKARYWNNVVTAAPQFQALDNDGRSALHKRFFGVLPGEVGQAEPPDNVDRTDHGIGSDLVGAWVKGSNSLVAGAGWAMKAAGADKVGQAVMNVGTKGMKAGSDMMSDEGIEAGKKKFLTTNWDESVLTHPRALAMAAVESLPGMVVPMGATATVARAAAAQAAKKAATVAAKRGASAAVTERFASKAAAAAMKKAVIPASIAGEVAVSASGVGQQTYTEVMGMKPEDLEAKSETYRETVKHYVDSGLSEEEARGLAQEAVAMSASRIAAAVSAPASALAGYVGGKWMGHVLGEAPASVGKEAVRGAATEVAQEVPQSASEQFGQNVGVKMRADETRNLGEGVAEAAAMGGITAGPMGGAFGALHGMGGKGDEKPAPGGTDAGGQPNNPGAADIPSDALRQRAADLAGSDSEWDAKVRDEINAELTRRGEPPAEPPPAAAQADVATEQPAAAPATNEVPGHVGYDLEQMNAQQQPAPGLGGIADRAQQHPAMQVPDNVDPKTGEVIDQLPALNDTQLVEEVRGMMATGAPPLAKEIAEKFGIDRERAGRVLNAAWAVVRQAPADTAPQSAAPATMPAAPTPSEFPTMHLAQQALAGSGQAETHRVAPKGARFVIEPKPETQTESTADVAAVGQPVAPEAAEQAPAAAPIALNGTDATQIGTQQDPVVVAKAALAAHRTTTPAKGQVKAWAEKEKSLQKAVKSARKAANAAPAPTAQQPAVAPELPEINFRADREAALAAKAAGAQAGAAPGDSAAENAVSPKPAEAAAPVAEAPPGAAEEHRAGQRKAPATAKDAYHEAVAAQVRHEDDESPTLSGLPVGVRRRIHEERVAAKMKAKPLPLDPTSGLINGKEVLDESITEEGTPKGTMLEAIFNAAINHVKAGGTAHVSELDLGNLGGINHFAGQVGGDRAIAGVSKAMSGAVEAAGHGDKIELSRYGGDEFFSAARDLDVGTIGRTLDAANTAAHDYMDKTTPRMLNPNLETSIRQDKTLSEEEKAVVLSHMDTPLSHLPKKPAKGADGKTFYGPGNTKLHVGKQVQVTADVSAADLHQEADSSLAAAKNANYKEGGKNERKTDELEGLRRDGQRGAQAPAAGEVGAGGSKPDSDETGSGAVVGRSATGGAVDSAVARGAGERGGQQDGVKPAAGATPADGKVAPKKSSGAATATTAKPEQPASKIEDFGETLHGARKHYAQAYKDQIAASESVDIAAEPLSKSWPEPDYQKLLDDGVDPWVVAFVRVNRDAVPTKPKKGWKLKSWSEGASALRDSANKALRGEYTVEQMKEQLAKNRFNRLSQKISGVIDLYVAVGHEKSLKGIDFSLSHYSLHGGVKYSPAKAIWTVSRESKSTAFGNWPTELAIGDTREEAIAAFKAKYATMDAPAAKKAEVKFTIYSRSTDDPRKFYIGKKVGQTYFDLKSFATSKEARDFLENNHGELVRLLANNKEIPPERRETNEPRVGVDHRSGADVTPEQFSETFGFRGVQFGNYVEGSRRQQDLNNAYDALMDLAGVIGVPPKALSLNGELGLAFGARGKGGARPAAAHYESGTVVINLTKGAGAGSLAHEWWHSVDNYFSRARDGSGRHYMTDSLDVSLAARGSNFVAKPGVRKEMVQAFGDIMRGINRTSVKERSKNLDARRTKAYWSTDIEMSARAFESYVIAKLQDQGASNDYLANIVSEEAWDLEEGYPYPTAGEIADIRAGFDTFFNVVQTKATDKGVAMFSLNPGAQPQKSFAQQVKERLASGEARGDTLNLGRTPAILRQLGFSDLPLRMPASVLFKLASGKGGTREALTEAQIAKLPELIDEPLAVYDSKEVKGALVIVTKMKTPGGLSVIVSVAPDGREAGRYGLLVNVVTSAYGKGRGDAWFADQAAAGRLRYAENKEGLHSLGSAPVTIREDASRESPTTQKVLFKGDLDKYRQSLRAAVPGAKGGDGRLSIGQGGKIGMPANTIRNMIDRMKAGSAGIRVVQSAKELPRAILDDADRRGISHDKIRGAHFAGVSYVVADNVTAKEVQSVVFHEAYVHGGLRSRYGASVESRMVDLANNLQGGGKPYVRVMRLAKQQGINLIAYERGLERDGTKTERQKLAVLTEELTAHMGETTGSLRAYLEEVVGMIRKFLRDVGLANLSEIGVTDLRHELKVAREAYLNQAADTSGAPAFSLSRPAVGQGKGGTLQPNSGDVAYNHEIRSREQLLLDANSALHLNGRGNLGVDSEERQEPSRYAGERGGQGGAAVQGATSARAGREEQARLVSAAKEHGFFIGLGHPLFEALETHEASVGEEHEAYIVGKDRNRVVIRQTKRGEFGHTSQYSPVQYLKRLEEYNKTFPATQIHMIGVHEDADGLVSIFTVQQFVPGEEFATQKELDAAMRANGWFTLGMNDYEYTHKDTGAVIGDAHTGNVLHIGNELFPIDVIVQKMPKASSNTGDTPAFSLRGDSGKAQASTVTNLRSWLRNQLAIRTQSSRAFNLLWHRGVGTQYHKGTIDKHYKRVYDIGQEYLNGVARNAADSMEAAPTLLGRMDNFSDWWRDAKSAVTSLQDKADLKAIGGPIFDGTLKDKKQYTDQELKKQFGLNDRQVGLYREFRNAVEVSLHGLAKAEIFDRLKSSKSLPKEVLDTMRDLDVDLDTFAKYVRGALAKHLKAHDGDAEVKKAVAEGLTSVKEISERINNLLNEGYAPLMRFGEYTVTVKDKAGKVEHFSMHESQADANAAKAALEKEVPTGYSVESGVMAEGEHEMFKGVSPETIALFGEAAGITKDEAYQEYLKKAVANRSALKRLIHRKEIPGFDKDVQRVLASFVTSNARRAAKLTHLDQLDEAVEAIPQKKGDVKTEAIKFRKYMLDTGSEAQKLRRALFTYYITGSIASAAVNLTQPITMTYPYLTQWGAGRAAKEIARATKDAVASFGGHVPADVESAYNRAKRDGVVDAQNIFNMMAMAEGTLTAESAASRSLKALNHSLAIAFSSAEALNRKSAFIAAYRIGRTLTKAQLEKAGVANAYEFGVKAVAETQGVYNRGNRPNIGRGAVGATVMTFKQFSISYVEFLRRLWKDDKGSFLIAVGILQMLAGALGQPFADDIEDVVGSAMSRMGFGENPEAKIRDVAQQAFGDTGGEFLLYGSSAVLPIDVHGRLGMGNLLPATGILNKFNTPAQQMREMLEIGGVAGGLAQAIISGQAMPAFARNAAKGAEMIATGEYKDTKGRKVMDATVGEGIGKMLGFQPSSVARETRALGAEMERVNAQRAMEGELADRRAAAVVDGDAKALKQVLADTAAWNERNPSQRIVITGDQISRRVREMKKSREERFLKRVPKEMRAGERERVAQ